MLIDHVFVIFMLFFGVFIIFATCSRACDYQNYSTGHRFVKAFSAYSSFQRLFTVFQSTKDINNWDLNKITYIGYFAAIICAITGIVVIPFSIVMYFFNKDIAIWTYLYWFFGSFCLSFSAGVLQILDSWLNYVLELFGK